MGGLSGVTDTENTALFYAEKVYLAVRSYTGGRVGFSGSCSKKSTIASEADDFELCTIAGW